MQAVWTFIHIVVIINLYSNAVFRWCQPRRFIGIKVIELSISIYIRLIAKKVSLFREKVVLFCEIIYPNALILWYTEYIESR